VPIDLAELAPLVQARLAEAWLVVSRPVEAGVLLGSCAGALTAFIVHRYYAKRAEVLPTLPSHAEALDGPQDQTTLFLAAVHDMSMSVTDAWNATRARRVHREPLEALLNLDTLLPACDAVQQQGAALRGYLAEYASLAGRSRAGRDLIEASWSHRQKDHYRTETYIVSSTDSKGRSRTEVRTRQVYDYSDHWFAFHRDVGLRARDEVGAVVGFGATAALPVPDLGRLRVRLAALSEPERMFLRRMIQHTILEDGEAELDETCTERLVNQWLVGARLGEWLRSVHGWLDRLRDDHVAAFGTIMGSEPVSHYRVSSRTHEGPPGRVQSTALVGLLDGILAGWASVEGMLATCEGAAFDLARWARNPAEVEGDVAYVRRAVAAYEGAFPDSEIDIDQLPRHWVTGLAGVGVAMVLGGLTWYGLSQPH
jgi:hypothetical protein